MAKPSGAFVQFRCKRAWSIPVPWPGASHISNWAIQAVSACDKAKAVSWSWKQQAVGLQVADSSTNSSEQSHGSRWKETTILKCFNNLHHYLVTQLQPPSAICSPSAFDQRNTPKLVKCPPTGHRSIICGSEMWISRLHRSSTMLSPRPDDFSTDHQGFRNILSITEFLSNMNSAQIRCS
jgi:hypothetical protein